MIYSAEVHWLAAVFIATGISLQPLPAQTSSHVHELQDQIPPDRLAPPERMTGIGNVHLQITAAPEAQLWFDQGLNLIHDFWDFESARAFEQSIRVDPNCAMCYWGLYQAESFYHSLAKDYAQEALDKAIALKGHASPRERLYIEATASGKPDLWRKLATEYREDAEAQLMFATSLRGTEELQVLEAILKADPNNSAANHYYIHALEASDPARALKSAEILPSLAPNSGHMVHMPGHIFFRLGDYGRAEQAFAQAMQVDERYLQEQHVSPDYDWNYVHNLMYAITNLAEEGKLREATVFSGKLNGGRGNLEASLYVYQVRDGISRIDPHLPVALRAGDWKGALKLLRGYRPETGQPHLEFLATQLTRFTAGMEALRRNRVNKAERLSAELGADLKRASEGPAKQEDAHPKGKLRVQPDALLPPLLKNLSIMSLELRASIAARQGRLDNASQVFAKAEKAEAALGYREPPAYIRPVAESEGAAMLAVRNWPAALAAYRRAERARPHSGWALYGIALCAEKSGDAAGAVQGYREFLAAWKNADPDLPEVKHAKKMSS